MPISAYWPPNGSGKVAGTNNPSPQPVFVCVRSRNNFPPKVNLSLGRYENEQERQRDKGELGQKMKSGFSIAELMIVVAILGILAAIVIPQFQQHTTEAKISAAKNNLYILRGAIELYAAQHNSIPPGYPGNDRTKSPSMGSFFLQMVKYGDYFRAMPENPFNDEKLIKVIADSEPFPAEATGEFAWVYKPATKEIRLDWPGTDKNGVRYYDY